MLENADDFIDGANVAEELGEVVFERAITPNSLGVKMIADNSDLLKIWNDNLRHLAKAETKEAKAFQKYLRNLENGVPMTNKELGAVWKKVRARFGRQAKKNGMELPKGDEIHHWNYNKADFPEQLTNPNNLSEPISRDFHQQIHEATQSGKLWESPIKTENIIPINSSPL